MNLTLQTKKQQPRIQNLLNEIHNNFPRYGEKACIKAYSFMPTRIYGVGGKIHTQETCREGRKKRKWREKENPPGKEIEQEREENKKNG